jgi:hypothetical protein
MSESQRKLKPGDRVELGVPSWLSTGGIIIFGGRRPLRSPDEAQIPAAGTEQLPEKTSDGKELGPFATKERMPDP